MADKQVVEQDDSMDFLDMMPTMMIMMMGMMMVMWPMMQQVNSIYSGVQAQRYVGIMDSVELVADPQLRIYNITSTPSWSFAIVKNLSASPLYFGINTPDHMVTIGAGGIYRIDRLGADIRISSVYYQAPPTKQVLFRIDYEY